jgi:hypothetical protein
MKSSINNTFEPAKIDGLDGDWLHFGKNELGSEVYLRVDNITRVPISNLNICIFDRMLSNRFSLNNEGDKSTVIRRGINFTTKEFKDFEFTIFKKEMCRGTSENFSLNLHDKDRWSKWEEGSWDEFFSDVLENAGASFNGLNMPHLNSRLNKLTSQADAQSREYDLYEQNRKADWTVIKWFVCLFGIIIAINVALT